MNPGLHLLHVDAALQHELGFLAGSVTFVWSFGRNWQVAGELKHTRVLGLVAAFAVDCWFWLGAPCPRKAHHVL